ncbi:type II toxin-antitoxin system RelE/ParE family toxin [Streptomyces sp. NPDC002054]|uniref:type II toxin-antitoxin system RelE/ParE family toxin n=1 Tax=Streptomyces sp. NPDC002054 TaxID=3154663 RepID=UPI003325140E
MDWEVIVVEPALSWLHRLRRDDRASLIQISKAITALQREGPAMGRPLVDTVKGSRIGNLKELRPGSVGGTEIRLLFVFDPLRRAVFLVGGDKAGDWQGWYHSAIPRAEQAYAHYLSQMEEDTP